MFLPLLLATVLAGSRIIKDDGYDPTPTPKKPLISTTVWIIIVVIVIIVGSVIIALIIKYFWCNRFRGHNTNYISPDQA